MKKKKKEKRSSARRLLLIAMLFYFLAFGLLFLYNYDTRALLLAGVIPVLIFVSVLGLPKLFPSDRLLLSLSSFLAALGVLVLYRLNPDRGISQLLNYMVAIAAMLALVILATLVLRPGSESFTACALEKPIYPASIRAVSVASKSEAAMERAAATAIPEFKRFNIIENEVRNVI